VKRTSPAGCLRVASARGRALAAAACALLAALPSAARADAWSPALFSGPNGTSAQGFATEAVGTPGVRLLVGCETGADAWRGVALLERDPGPGPSPPGDGSATEVVTAFFGRAPVAASWRSRVTSDGVLSWPAAAEELRRGLQREDATRGQATLRVEIRRGEATRQLAFGVDGIAARAPELAAMCDGWGAAGATKRRERGW
jgi:hypothetical protein